MKHVTTGGIAKIENTLNKIAREEALDRKDGYKSRAQALRHARGGMHTLARELGVVCICAEKAKGGRGATGEKCVCGSTKDVALLRLQRMRERGTARGPITLAGPLAGTGCRDAQGKFVPVSQCNPAQYMGKWITLP